MNRVRGLSHILSEETITKPDPRSVSKAVPSRSFLAFDHRSHLYIGQWRRSFPKETHHFAQDVFDEPHVKRRLTILHTHPDMTKLYGSDRRTFYILFISVSLQVYLAYAFSSGSLRQTSAWLFVAIALFVGGTIAVIMGVIIHEATHNLIFSKNLANRFAGLLANVPLLIPIAMSFRRYHFDHHAYQGVAGKDPDLPLDFETRIVSGSTFGKMIWLACYPIMYVLRGAMMKRRPSFWEMINLAVTLLIDLLIYWMGGWTAIGYLALSTWFGYSIHPAAAHFIQEHYTWRDGQETYSYYGPFNALFLNIGFHNEHHDFPRVAWSRLPDVKKAAPEFYEPLAYHTSWIRVFWEFVTSNAFGPQSRVERTYECHKNGRKMVLERASPSSPMANLPTAVPDTKLD